MKIRKWKMLILSFTIVASDHYFCFKHQQNLCRNLYNHTSCCINEDSHMQHVCEQIMCVHEVGVTLFFVFRGDPPGPQWDSDKCQVRH